MRIRLRLRIKKRYVFLLIVIILVAGYFAIDAAIKPAIFELSEAVLRNMALEAMNDAINETAGDVKYEDLINIVKDDEGKITMLQSNSLKMNDLSSQTALKAQHNITNLGMQGIDIPIGTVIGGQLLSGKGPPIHINFEPVGSVTSSFSSEFEEAGINQTRHKIYLILDANIRLVIGNSGQRVEVSNEVLVSETVIVGNVPQTYLQSDDKSEMFDLVP